MGSWNMPDGVTESMIPGYNDVEMDIEFDCECGNEWTEPDMMVDPSSGGHEVEATCPECGAVVKFNWEPYDPRCDDEPDYEMMYPAQDHPNY
jgi:hypothetical protein